MSIKRINGTDLERMVKMAYLNLQKHEATINAMNVFPVTDGDTGTNMRLTLLNGIHHATPNTHLGNYLKQLSDGMLLGARGNSGVILSQIFRGFYLALSSDSIADVGELRDAFILGYKTAYQSVTRPVEGTILTVAREGIENIKSQISRNTYIPNLISMYVAEMRKTLSHTPEMLPVLKEAGVVDSGGYGYILMMEGMEKCLYGEEISVDEETWLAPAPTPMVSIGSSAKFNENSNFELGYCMEFLLQLMRCKTAFCVAEYTQTLYGLGDSLVVVQNDSIVKVHVHTKTPADIISYSQQFGEFVSFKMDNMQLQHDELYADATPTPKAPHKPIAMIAISNGEGIADLFSSFGCDVVIDGGQTMNTSAQEILDAIGSLSADKIVVYPNHENIFKAAEQAVALSGQSNVVIMPAKSVMECYYSMAMDIADCEDVEQRLRMLENGCRAIAVTSVTQCVKDCVCNGVVCLKGEYVVIFDGDPIACVPTYLDVVQVLLDRHLLENAEMCIVFCGKDAIGFSEEEFQKAVEAQSPMLEVAFVEGNQRIYDLIIGVVI